MRLFAVLICLGCFIAAFLQLDHFLPLLPAKIAIRFDFDGTPNGWMGKDAFALYYFFLLGVMLGVFGIFAAAVHKLPARFINIPHRDYWLAEPQRKATIGYLRELYLWTAAFSGIFIVGMMDMVLRINLTAAPKLDSRVLYTACGAFAFCILCGIALVYWRFRKPDEKA